MSGAIAVAALAGAGVFLILQRGLVRIAIGLSLLQHSLNVLLLLARGHGRRGVPIYPYENPPSDPLAHAFALTAIVITLGTTVFLLALAFVHAETSGEEDVEEPR